MKFLLAAVLLAITVPALASGRGYRNEVYEYNGRHLQWCVNPSSYRIYVCTNPS